MEIKFHGNINYTKQQADPLRKTYLWKSFGDAFTYSPWSYTVLPTTVVVGFCAMCIYLIKNGMHKMRNMKEPTI